MKRLFTKQEEQLIYAMVYGCQAHIQSGIGSTLQNPHSCNIGWFAGETTIILGSGDREKDKVAEKTVAIWRIPVNPQSVSHMTSGFLIISCERIHGGLHTQDYGSIAKVEINGHNRDIIGLKDIPQGHDDYFHRPTLPQIPDIWPISGCGTIYAWPIHKEHLSETGNQLVKIEIDDAVSWDIDYVMLALKVTKASALLPNWVQQLIYIILAALMGAIAARLIAG